MNQIVWTNPGGKPITQDDFNFWQSANAEAFNALTAMLPGVAGSGKGYILSGCGLYLNGGTNTYWNYAGYAVLDRLGVLELFYVPSANLGINSLIGQNIRWNISDVSVAPDPDVFKNFVSRNTHRRRTAYLSVTQGGWAYDINFTFMANMGAALSTFNWNTVGAGGQPAFQGNWHNYANPVRFAKNQLGMVMIQGVALPSAGGGSSTNIFVLPAGFRPGQDLAFSINKTDGAGNITSQTLFVAADGHVSCSDAQPNCQFALSIPAFPGEQ